MQKVFAALNRADEIGGEVRDWIQERVVDRRYIAARKRLAACSASSSSRPRRRRRATTPPGRRGPPPHTLRTSQWC
jgi:hypothetical protein